MVVSITRSAFKIANTYRIRPLGAWISVYSSPRTPARIEGVGDDKVRHLVLRRKSTGERKLLDELTKSQSSHEGGRTMSKSTDGPAQAQNSTCAAESQPAEGQEQKRDVLRGRRTWLGAPGGGGRRWRNPGDEGGRRATSRQFDAGRGAKNVRRDRPANHEDLPN